MKHTQGEWTIINHSWSDTGIYSGTERIALIDIGDDATEDTQKEWEEKAAANARLIAAAPDLLASLIALDEAFCSLNDNMTREERQDARIKLIAARAAVAKATGKTA